MNRRIFIKKSAAAGLSLGLPIKGINFSNDPGQVKLTILHTNDMHSRIDPFPENDSQYAGLGGMARRAGLIQKIRGEEKNVLLLDAGDIFQGTPYFNFFGGELEFKLMSHMNYDASTLGNHDFDNGLEGLRKMLPFAKFPFLIANYDFSNTILNGIFKPYKIFKKDHLKIGVFGLGIELKGLVIDKLTGKTTYIDPVPTAKEMVRELKRKQCDLIICLSHLGYEYKESKISDVKLAEQVSGIDLIIGGHTHTFLDKPAVVVNSKGHQTLINQVGWGGLKLGRIDYTFENKTKRNIETTDPILINNPGASSQSIKQTKSSYASWRTGGLKSH